MREVDSPLVGGNIGALSFGAQVAKEALFYDFVVISFIDAVDLEGIGFVDKIEQCWKGVAQANAASATMADVKNTFHLCVQRISVVEIGVLPV